jgi:hypothetical protein
VGDRPVVVMHELQRKCRIRVQILGRVPGHPRDRPADELVARRPEPVPEDDVRRAVDEAEQLALAERARPCLGPRAGAHVDG